MSYNLLHSSPHTTAQPASLDSAEPSPHCRLSQPALSALGHPHMLPLSQPALTAQSHLNMSPLRHPACPPYRSVQTPSITNARRHSLSSDTLPMLCCTTQTSLNESSQPLSFARNSNNTCECKRYIDKIKQDIVTIFNKLSTKENEIQLLNEVKTAYTVIELLQQRISELEKKGRRVVNQQKTPRTQIPSKCLLVGDTNLRRILKSDSEDNCSVRTIPYANMDLLRSWVREIKLDSL